MKLHKPSNVPNRNNDRASNADMQLQYQKLKPGECTENTKKADSLTIIQNTDALLLLISHYQVSCLSKTAQSRLTV